MNAYIWLMKKNMGGNMLSCCLTLKILNSYLGCYHSLKTRDWVLECYLYYLFVELVSEIFITLFISVFYIMRLIKWYLKLVPYLKALLLLLYNTWEWIKNPRIMWADLCLKKLFDIMQKWTESHMNEGFRIVRKATFFCKIQGLRRGLGG